MIKKLALSAFLWAAVFAAGETRADEKPSARLGSVMNTALDAVLAPLEKDPPMPRVEVEKLSAEFTAAQLKAANPMRKAVYSSAIEVCDALTKAMDERAKARADALASAKTPTMSTGGGIVKSAPIRGSDAGAAGEAIRKKQLDERRYADREAKQKAVFTESLAYKVWTDRATKLKTDVMDLYKKELQFEAYNEANLGFVGNWRDHGRKWTVELDASKHVLARTEDGGVLKGTWEVGDNGVIHVHVDNITFNFKISDDGQALNAVVAKNMHWDRVKSEKAK